MKLVTFAERNKIDNGQLMINVMSIYNGLTSVGPIFVCLIRIIKEISLLELKTQMQANPFITHHQKG